MPKTYHKADAGVLAIIAKVRSECHPDLVEVDTRIGAILIEPARDKETGEPLGPAIKLAGAKVAAKIRITTPKQRVHLPYDAIIEIDKDLWDDAADDQREALIDHELTHLVVARDRDACAIIGEDLRPRLKTRPDDWLINGFISVVQRRGQAAIEYQSMDKLVSRPGYKQLLFPWMAEAAVSDQQSAISKKVPNEPVLAES